MQALRPRPGPAGLALALALGAACSRGPDGPDGPAGPARAGGRTEPAAPDEPLPDEAQERGLDHVNVSGTAAKAVVLEANGAGVALLDLGSDGDLDVVFAQGLPALGALAGDGAALEVFLNDGAGRFQRGPAPAVRGWWTGLAAGDVDGDGDADLVAAGFGELRVLLQDANGTLQPGADLITAEERAASAPSWTTSVALFDLDRDGALDLYACRYLDLDPAAPPLGALGEGPLAIPCTWRGHPVYCGPRGLQAQPDALFRGRGDGTFERADARLPDVPPGYALGVLATDADGDGDTDLFVANDSSPNLLLVNDGGRFTDFGYEAGVALGPDGQKEAGMGVAAGDVDGDGRADLVVTNFSDEPTRLLLAADVGYRDATHRAGLGRETRRVLSWGVHLVDLDGDGARELFTANGHVYPQADLPHTGTSYGQRDGLWHLDRGAAARPVEPATPRSLLFPGAGSRGSAVGDVDGDGRPDLVVSRIDGPAALGINRFTGGPWLELRLAGDPAAGSPRDASGARVVVVSARGDGESAQAFEVTTSGSYQSSSTPFLHVGLGGAEAYTQLRVTWPSGRIEELGGGAARRRLWLAEGRGVVREAPLPGEAPR